MNKTLLISAYLLLFVIFPPLIQADTARQYHKLCATCHGNEGDGRGRAGANLSPPPSDFRRSKLTPRQMAQVIREGRPGTAMVGYGRRLSAAEVTRLVSYIQASFVHAPAAAPADNTPMPGQSIYPGQRIYEENCSACHGDKGNTAVWARGGLTPPPRNFTTEQARSELSRERMINSVTWGRPGTAMMSFRKRLSDEDIAAVVDFIRARFMRLGASTPATRTGPHPSAAAPVPHRPPVSTREAPVAYPGGLHGDVEAGRVFYQANCFSCHGRQGQGDGPRAHFNIPRPRDFTSPDSRRQFDRTRLFASIQNGKRGTVMPAWDKVLTQQQIANVAEYVYQTFILDTQVKKKSR